MPLDSPAEHLDEALNALSAAGYAHGLRVLQGCRLGPQKQRDDQGQSPGTNSMTMPPLGGGGWSGEPARRAWFGPIGAALHCLGSRRSGGGNRGDQAAGASAVSVGEN